MSVTISDSVTTIGDFTFGSCKSLTSVIIPKSVTAINSTAFCYCDNLTIYCYKGSYADTYAQENEISVVYLGEETAGIFVFKLSNTTAYYYDIDTKYEIAVPAQFVDGRTLVPLREVSTSIGITDLNYEASTGKITFTSFDGYEVVMTMESTVATLTKDGITVTETITAPVFVNGVAMFPLRNTANFTGGTVKYDASGYVVVSAGDVADEDISTYISAYEAK